MPMAFLLLRGRRVYFYAARFSHCRKVWLRLSRAMKKKKDCAFTGRTSLLWTSAVAVALFGWTAPRLLADEFSKTAHLSVRMFSTGTLFIDTRTRDLQIE